MVTAEELEELDFQSNARPFANLTASDVEPGTTFFQFQARPFYAYRVGGTTPVTYDASQMFLMF